MNTPIDGNPPQAGKELTASTSVDDAGADGDRPSVTDINGSVARFEMTYTPVAGERLAFGPPLRSRIFAYIYLALALSLSAIIAYGYRAPSNSVLAIWVVEGDHTRPMSASGLAFLVTMSAIATVIRAHMRGVVVHADGLEARYLLPLGIPRIRRWAWPQVHRLIVSNESVALELWDSKHERLPEVESAHRLAEVLVGIANARHIQVTRIA